MIDAKRVREIFKDCLLDEGYTDDTACISVYGVTAKFGLNPEK